MKLKHIALIGSLFPILFSIVLFFGVLISADSDDENSNFSSGITGMNLSAEVLKHQPMVEKYARENGPDALHRAVTLTKPVFHVFKNE